MGIYEYIRQNSRVLGRYLEPTWLIAEGQSWRTFQLAVSGYQLGAPFMYNNNCKIRYTLENMIDITL
jgi:hypothetical protein